MFFFRCGMVYVDPGQLGWKPYVTSWLQRVGAKLKQDAQVLPIATPRCQVVCGLTSRLSLTHCLLPPFVGVFDESLRHLRGCWIKFCFKEMYTGNSSGEQSLLKLYFPVFVSLFSIHFNLLQIIPSLTCSSVNVFTLFSPAKNSFFLARVAYQVISSSNHIIIFKPKSRHEI